jgi:mono/diheme cytochrome c family protein
MTMRIAFRRALVTILGVLAIGLACVLVVAYRAPIGKVPRLDPGSFPFDSVARGEVLAAEGHCASCHTATGGQPFAGGYGVNTPFGVIYGTNITPDADTGIGGWSREAFTRALREGVSRDGSHLFPTFPYFAYTRLTDADIADLYAYLMTRQPVTARAPKTTLPFPLSIRALQGGWKILFFRGGRYQPNPAKSAEWNRGAYVAESLSDCTGCHTPRNALGGEERRRAYAGSLVDGWIAPALTAANPAPIPWTESDLFEYLRMGISRLHGPIGATMTAIVRGGLASRVVPDADVRAIATYFSELNGAATRHVSAQASEAQALATSALGSRRETDPDAQLYAAACLACHYNAGSASPARPELGLSSALTLAEPTNLIQVVLYGVGRTDGAAGMVMPAYAAALSDSEIARLAAYLRRTRTSAPPWRDLPHRVAAIRRSRFTSR